MEKFYLEEPTIKRKQDAIEYIEEHFKYKSNIAGDSGLEEDYQNYESWLEKILLEKDPQTCPSERCCGIVYFLIRESDNKIIGLINLRWNLNEWMLKYAGHIGYGIRPTERRKGYNKINLYLCLLKAKELKIDKVLLTVDEHNLGSIKTIKALGGIKENKIPSYDNENILTERYWINVDDVVDKYQKKYKKYLKEK